MLAAGQALSEIRCGPRVGAEVQVQTLNPLTNETALGLIVLTAGGFRSVTYAFGCTFPRWEVPPPLWGRAWALGEWSRASFAGQNITGLCQRSRPLLSFKIRH